MLVDRWVSRYLSPQPRSVGVFLACWSVATDFFLNSQQSDLNRFLNIENPNGRHVYVL